MIDKVKEFPYFLLFGVIWRFLGTSKKTFLLALGGLFISRILLLTAPYLLGRLIDCLQHGLDTDHQYRAALIWVVLYFVINLGVSVFYAPARILERRAAFTVHGRYLEAMFEKVRQLPFGWHQNHHSAQLVDRIKKSSSGLEDFTGMQYVYIGFFMDFVGPLLVLMAFFPWAGVACLAMGGVAFVIVTKFDAKLVPLFGQRNELSHAEIGAFNDYMANIRTLITLRLGKLTQNEIVKRYLAKKKPLWREITLNETKWASVTVAADFFIALLLGLILMWMHQGAALQIGTVVMLVQYLTRFSFVFFNIASIYQQLVLQAASYKSARLIDDAFLHEIEINVTATPDIDTAFTSMRVQLPYFAYQPGGQPVLQDIDLVIVAGQKIALIGESGAGKSTLMGVLRGLYATENATLKIDNMLYQTLQPLSNHMTFIPQDPEIFENSVLYNITFSVEYGQDDIRQACDIACFTSVLDRLPEGLASDMREKGVNLSGGQRQRLALARGVLAIRESSVILMDEPTSSVDMPTEITIFDRLFAAFPEKTIIASIHRLNLLPLFDCVIVMEQGRIVQSGAFAELVNTDGPLQRSWREFNRHNPSDAS